MKLLAFETATEACSVALWLDGEVRERFELAPRRHAELALPWAEQLLAEAGIAKPQLDAIAVGRGPGAFTGVRLAIALGQGIALALDRPLLPVSTLAVLAMRAAPGPVLAALVAAHAASRGGLAALLWALPPARSDGLAVATGRPGGADALAAAVLGALPAFLLLDFSVALTAILAAAVLQSGLALQARRQIGGVTGDVLGGAQQLGEAAVLLVAAAGLA